MAHTLIAEDIHYSLSAWFKALAILEHLVEPDHCRIILMYPTCGNNGINCVLYNSLKHPISNPSAKVAALCRRVFRFQGYTLVSCFQ